MQHILQPLKLLWQLHLQTLRQTTQSQIPIPKLAISELTAMFTLSNTMTEICCKSIL